MADLNDRELNFLWSQGIDESEVLDCADMSSRRYKGAMEREGYLFCIAPRECYASHRLRSRSGHCVQCDTSRIAFIRRHYAEAYVYIAGSLSEKVLKVGNAIWPERRVSAINSRYYGGIRDWVMLYHVKYPDAGKVEFEAHRQLAEYRRSSREIFACGYGVAKSALMAESVVKGEDEWESRDAAGRYTFGRKDELRRSALDIGRRAKISRLRTS
jgi:hypothetical protein